MSSYQTFGAAKGSSRSLEKLNALELPRLKGLSFLDVGCNEGFFCGFALARGAAPVVGLDQSAAVINAARRHFPGVTFLVSDWANLPADRFDVVLLASSLHYAEDQEALIHRLMERVNPDGTLVLEIGIADDADDLWVEHERHDGVRRYATLNKIATVLARYAYKKIGPSVMQTGDSVARFVFHVRHKRPMILLLASEGYTGKSTLARTLAATGVPVCSLDSTLANLFAQPPPGRLGEAVVAAAGRIDPAADGGKMTWELFDAGLGLAFINAALGAERPPITVLDGYLTPDIVKDVVRELERDGWAVWTAAPPLGLGLGPREMPEESVVRLGGELMFLGTSGMRGGVDKVRFDGDFLRVSGWAVDEQTRTAARAFCVRLAGRELTAYVNSTIRLDVNKILHLEDDINKGFDLLVRLGPEDAKALASGTAELEMFAVGTNRDVTRLTDGNGRWLKSCA